MATGYVGPGGQWVDTQDTPNQGNGALSPIQSAAIAALGGEGVSGPVSLITAAAGAVGVLTGRYYYTCTFYTANGETDTTTAAPNFVDLTAQRANLSNIPVSSSPLVIGRRIYRNSAANGTVPLWPKQQLCADIPNNTQTTYIDNLPDGSLGVSIPRISTTQGRILINGVRQGNFGSLTTGQGLNCLQAGTGYANTAYGGNCMTFNTSGQRNTGYGVFALYLNTTGDEHTAFGVHALNSVDGRNGSTAVGYAAGITWTGGNDFHRVTLVGAYAGNFATTASGMTAVGYLACQLATTAYNVTAVGEGAGRGNTTGGFGTFLGYQAGNGSSTANYVTAVGGSALEAGGAGSSTALGALAGQGATGTNNLFLGAFAGMFETGSNSFLLDTYLRSNEAEQRTNALFYGTHASTPAAQRLNVNGLLRPAQLATASRPAWSSALRGFCYFDTTTNKLVLAGASAWETVTSA